MLNEFIAQCVVSVAVNFMLSGCCYLRILPYTPNYVLRTEISDIFIDIAKSAKKAPESKLQKFITGIQMCESFLKNRHTFSCIPFEFINEENG